MLAWRLSISFVLIPLLIGLFVVDSRCGESAPVLLLVCLLLAWRGCWEMGQLLSRRVESISWNLTAWCSTGLIVVAWLPHWDLPNPASAADIEPLGLAFAVAVLVLFLREAMRFEQPGMALPALSAHVLIVGYVGLLLGITAKLRWISPDGSYLALGSLVVGVKAGDVGGYTIGRLFGRAKLIPRLSPGKTRAGGFGALGGAALATWGFLEASHGWLGTPPPPAWAAVCYGLLLGLVGLVGDLCESLIKRDVEAKDSAVLLPGFGGLLDLLDSVLYTGPVALILWEMLPLS